MPVPPVVPHVPHIDLGELSTPVTSPHPSPHPTHPTVTSPVIVGNGDFPPSDPGVTGVSSGGNGIGVLGQSSQNSGVVGTSVTGQGITAFSDNGIGIFSQGAMWAAVFNGAVVVSKGPSPKGIIKPNDINGSIVIREGNLFVNDGHIFASKGTLSCLDVMLANADCAEDSISLPR